MDKVGYLAVLPILKAQRHQAAGRSVQSRENKQSVTEMINNTIMQIDKEYPEQARRAIHRLPVQKRLRYESSKTGLPYQEHKQFHEAEGQSVVADNRGVFGAGSGGLARVARSEAAAV